MRYDLHFKDHGGRIFAFDHLDADNDQQAIAAARRIYRCGIGLGYELLQDGRSIWVEKFGLGHENVDRQRGSGS